MSYSTKRAPQVTDLVERFRRFAMQTTDQRYIDMFLRAACDIERVHARCGTESSTSAYRFSQGR